jgi:DNA gyrase/topoisomerase IV subunit A
MASQEGVSDGDRRDGHSVLLVLDSGGRLRSRSIAGLSVESKEPVQVGFKIGEMEGVSYRMAMTSDSSQRLLMITSNYRFLLTTPDHLADLQELNLEPGAYFQLKKDEHLSAVGAWSTIKAHNNMLLVTSRGYARIYKLDRLIESIEGPTPLRFDQPLTGLPLMVVGCDSEGALIAVSGSGRAVRFHLEDIPTQGIQAINRRDGERIVGALIAGKDDELVIVTADGFGRRLSTREIPVPAKQNARGRVMVSRKVVAGISRITPGELLYAMSGRQMIPFDPGALPRDSQTRAKSYPIPELKDRHVLGLVDHI